MSINVVTKNLPLTLAPNFKNSQPLIKQNNDLVPSQIVSSTPQKISDNTLQNSLDSVDNNKKKQINNNNNNNLSNNQSKQRPLTFIPNSNNLVQPQIKSPKISVPLIKYNRVPIYKQRSQFSLFPSRDSNVSAFSKSQINNNTLFNMTTNDKLKLSVSKNGKKFFYL